VNAEIQRIARDAGYGEDVMTMHQHHVLAHTFLAEARGLRWSPALRHVAGGEQLTKEDQAIEEELVLAFQRYVNTGRISASLYQFPNPKKLKTEFLHLNEVLWNHEKSL